MGAYITNLWWGGDPDSPDPFSGLSKRDVYNVQRSWSTIHAQRGLYGLQLFLRLFRKDPTTQNFFKSIQGVSEERISNSIQFKAHVQNLMSSFNASVENLPQPEVVAVLMEKIGVSHRARSLQEHHFDEFKEILWDFLKMDLKLKETIMESWIRFIDFIYKHIFDQLKP